MNIPYTYLIGWSKCNKWYYGVRYSKHCHPVDLWVKYFTSSKAVKNLRLTNGDPDVIEIRRTFTNTKDAKRWEDKVLARLKVYKKDYWLNQSTNYSFRSVDRSWNEGMTKDTSVKLKQVGISISTAWMQKIKNGYKSPNKGKKRSIEFRKENSWIQIKKGNPHLPFNSHQEFIDYCVQEYFKGLGVCTISANLNLSSSSGNMIKKQLEYAGLAVTPNQTISKILKRMPDFRFKDYNSFSTFCLDELKNGKKLTNIAKSLNVSYDAVKKATCNYHNLNL